MDNVKTCSIALGSGSKIKIEATQEVFQGFKILPYGVESGVPPQPIGKKQTSEGAVNRARGALKQAGKEGKCVACAIGVENGMWTEDGKNQGSVNDGGWVDGACLVAIFPKTDQRKEEVISVSWSDTIIIPKKRSFPGGPNGEWSILKDPHKELTGGKKPRRIFLVEGLERLAKEVHINFKK